MDKGNIKTIDWWPDSDLDLSLARAVPEYQAIDRDVNEFQRCGVVLLKGVFSNWVDFLREGLERQLSRPFDYAFPCESVPKGESGRFFDSYCNWHRVPEYLDFVIGSQAASMAGQFMRSAVAQFFHEHVFCKEIGTEAATPWHHDLPYYPLEGNQTVSIYVPLDYIPEETAVKFVSGSHRWTEVFFARRFIDGANYIQNDPSLSSVPDIEATDNVYEVKSWPLDPGDALLFDFRTLHGTSAAKNHSRRRAFSTRWLGDDVVYMDRSGETSPPLDLRDIVSGEKMPGDWFPIVWRRPTG